MDHKLRPREQTTQALDWVFDRVDRIDCAVRQADGKWIHPDRPRGRHLAGLDRAGVNRMLPMLRARNAHGADVYWRPARGDAALVLLDDLDLITATAIARKYAALVVETSAGNTQVWLALHRPHSVDERLVIQRDLIHRIGADPGAAGGMQLGRLPGFRSWKHDPAPWVNLVEASGGTAYRPDLPARGRTRARDVPADPGRSRAPPPRVAGEMVSGDRSHSGMDWHVACRMLVAGKAVEDVIEHIAQQAYRRAKRRTPEACRGYAERTVRRAEAAAARGCST